MFFFDYRVNKSSTIISLTPCSSVSLLSSCHWRTAREKTNLTHAASAFLRYKLEDQTARPVWCSHSQLDNVYVLLIQSRLVTHFKHVTVWCFEQGLFRNYSDALLPVLKPHMERLAGDSHESTQRCVAEIIAGLVRGSKHWNFNQVWDYKECH